MITNFRTGWALILAFSVWIPSVVKAEDKPGSPVSAPVYKPPARGTPAVRVTGATRSGGGLDTTLDVLAPNHVGLTTQEQPALFWYQSQPSRARFELAVTEEGKFKPLINVKIEEAAKAGVQELKLTDQHVKLSPDVEYQWVVALVTDPDNRSKDLIASGIIKRIAPSDELKAKLAKGPKTEWPAIYAQEGLWYDAIQTLSDLIAAEPDNKVLHAQRAALLEQVGLKNPATYDQKLAAKN